MELPDLTHYPGTSFEVQGKSYLYFGGTAYLGMSSLPEFRKAMSRHSQEWGVHWGASRIGNVRLSVYEKAEALLAQWSGSPVACTLSSGFLAGRLLSEAFAQRPYRPFYAPSCHAALLPARAVRFESWDALRGALAEHLAHPGGQKAVVFSDSLEFSEGPSSLLPVFDTLPKSGVTVVADDSHGIGITGAAGGGVYPELAALGFEECLVTASLGKAMGVTAGVILGTSARIAELRSEPLFSGASPAPPATMATLSEGLQRGWYASRLSELQANIDYFHKRLPPGHQLYFHRGNPVCTFQDPLLARHLFDHRIIITHFDYPAEAGSESPSRIVISAAHRQEHLDQLIQSLFEYYKSQ